MKRICCVFLLVLITGAQAIAQRDSLWTIHAGILFSKFSGGNTNSEVFSGLDVKAGYQLSEHFTTGGDFNFLYLDDSNTEPYTVIGAGPFLRWHSQKLFLDIAGTYSSGKKKKETIQFIIARFAAGAIRNISPLVAITPQVFLQYEQETGNTTTETFRPGILIAVSYRFPGSQR